MTFSASASRDTIRRWLRPNGVLDTSRRDNLATWVKQSTTATWNAFLDNNSEELDRRRAIIRLKML